MLTYALKRLLLAFVIVGVAVALMFVMIHAIPGDPVSIILGPRATPELKTALIEKMGLNYSLPVQVLIFFGNLLRGDLGLDVFSNRPVADIVLGQLPHTLELIGCSILWSALLGVGLGAYSAAHRDSIADKTIAILSIAFVAAPAFVVALLSLLLFAVKLGWFPAIGVGDDEHFIGRLPYLVLPSLAIGISWVGYVARLTRSAMLETLGEQHIRTARAFGLAERKIVFNYALRCAVLPVITVIGVGMGFLLSSAVFVEIVFARPGIGKLIIDSITTRNYPIVMGSVLITTGLFVLSTTIADLVNAALDPRTRDAL